MQNVTLPTNLTAIGNSMFANCSALREITIPSNVTSIGNSAFSACYSLQELTIPANVTTLGTNTFANCSSLTELHFKGSTPPTAQSSTFANLPVTCTIYVPTGKLSAYTGKQYYPSSSTYTYVEE